MGRSCPMWSIAYPATERLVLGKGTNGNGWQRPAASRFRERTRRERDPLPASAVAAAMTSGFVAATATVEAAATAMESSTTSAAGFTTVASEATATITVPTAALPETTVASTEAMIVSTEAMIVCTEAAITFSEATISSTELMAAAEVLEPAPVVAPVEFRMPVVKVIPRPGADEDPADEIFRTPVPIRCARKGIIRVEPVGAYRGSIVKAVIGTYLDADCHLRVGIDRRER